MKNQKNYSFRNLLPEFGAEDLLLILFLNGMMAVRTGWCSH